MGRGAIMNMACKLYYSFILNSECHSGQLNLLILAQGQFQPLNKKPNKKKIPGIQEQCLLTDVSFFLTKLDEDAFSTLWFLIPMHATYVFKRSFAAISFVIFSSEGKQKMLDFKNLRYPNGIVIPSDFPYLCA